MNRSADIQYSAIRFVHNRHICFCEMDHVRSLVELEGKPDASHMITAICLEKFDLYESLVIQSPEHRYEVALYVARYGVDIRVLEYGWTREERQGLLFNACLFNNKDAIRTLFRYGSLPNSSVNFCPVRCFTSKPIRDTFLEYWGK